jgi:hypothetical protein
MHRGLRRRGLMKRISLILAYFTLCGLSLFAQDQSQQAQVININISRSIQAVNYRAKGSTRIDFRGTALLPQQKAKPGSRARPRPSLLRPVSTTSLPRPNLDRRISLTYSGPFRPKVAPIISASSSSMEKKANCRLPLAFRLLVSSSQPNLSLP